MHALSHFLSISWRWNEHIGEQLPPRVDCVEVDGASSLLLHSA